MFLPESGARDKLAKRASRVQREFSGPVFRSAVNPLEILSQYDIGIIPYRHPPPYDNASPNKFGEYLAAGLPVLANRQLFAAELIEGLEIGLVFDWALDGDFVAAVMKSLRPEFA